MYIYPSITKIQARAVQHVVGTVQAQLHTAKPFQQVTSLVTHLLRGN